VILANLESYNSILIAEGKSKEERFEKLGQIVMDQLKRLDFTKPKIVT
jgi:hypothetical protein